MLAIALFFVLHWQLSVFCQSFYLHRYGAHRMFSMSKGWERFFHLLTYLTQGASFLSPFVGRLDDIGHDGLLLIDQIVRIMDNYDYPAEVLVASIRSPLHLLHAAEAGAHVATLPPAVIKQILQHPLTDAGLEKFLADWHQTKQKI